MWIPANAAELEILVSSGALDESSALDFKRELPGSTKELAKDVAAMANDGGTMVFGVGEDSSGRPVIPVPQRLQGAAERISSMIRAALSEPPEFSIKELPKADNPDTGYLAIVVPSSPRAPHMVVVKNDNRYYGRTAKGNTVLTEGEVARLYMRRKEWEVDRESYLDIVIKEVTLPTHENFGYLHLYARPVAPSPRRLCALGDRTSQRGALFQMMSDASRTVISGFHPPFGTGSLAASANGWKSGYGAPQAPKDTLTLHFHFDCETRLFLGRAAERWNDMLVLFESGIAETTMKFLILAGLVLDKCAFFGAVDVGLGLTGILGATSYKARNGMAGYYTLFDQPIYNETARVTSSELASSYRHIARDLLDRLFHATGAVGHFDPFASPEERR